MDEPIIEEEIVVEKDTEGESKSKKGKLLQKRNYLRKIITLSKNTLKVTLGTALLCGAAFLGEQSCGVVQNYIGKTVGEAIHQQSLHHPAEGRIEEHLYNFNFPNLENILQKLEEGRKGEGEIIVLDRNDQLLAQFRSLSQRVSSAEISPYVYWSLKAAEDRRFDYHQAWDLGSLTTALIENSLKKYRGEKFYPRGASSLSVQLADIIIPDEENDWKTTKIKEWLYATWLERTFTKEEILVNFLNLAYFGYSPEDGQHLVGIEPAAKHYFGKKAAEVDLTEALLLVSMIKKPTYAAKAFSDWQEGKREGKYPEFLRHRALYAWGNLQEMKEEVRIAISDNEMNEAKRRLNYGELNFHHQEEKVESARTSEYVREVMQRLHKINGKNEKLPGKTIVHTALDSELQEKVETLFRQSLEELRAKTKLPHPELINGAVVVMDTRTQEVLSLVGGVEITEKDFLNRATREYLIPGSAFKPLILALALEKGVAALSEEFLDAPKIFYLNEGPLDKRMYSPSNFKEEWTHQPLTLEEALIKSKNTIFVELNERVINTLGRNYPRSWLKQLGINIPRYSLSSILGPHNLSLLQLAGAYMLFPNQGKVCQYATGDVNAVFIQEVEHQKSREKVRPTYTHQAISYSTVAQMDQVLKEIVEEGTGKRAFLEGYDERGKTGTSEWSALFIGYEPALHTLVGVQFSSDEPEKTGKFGREYIGGKIAAPLAKSVFECVSQQGRSLAQRKNTF